MNAIAKPEHHDRQIAVPSDTSAMLLMIERAASDPNVDIDKMERLLEMHERMLARQANSEFAEALSAMQPDLPSIGERGNAAGRYTYALWEDINQAIKPILQRYGFALSFRMNFEAGITVTGVLSHRCGHKEQTSMVLPADKSGNKNDVQAIASSVSYGKRYTAGALLNLTSHGEDDDGFTCGTPRITDVQEAKLREMLEAAGADMPRFLAYMRVEKLSDIRGEHFATAVKVIRQKQQATAAVKEKPQ